MTDRLAVANTILGQLGGNKFIAMTGAHSLTGDKDRLIFKLKGNRKVSAVCIILSPSDTYEVEFFKIRGVDVKRVAHFEGLYAENLCSTFTEVTGLETSLF